MTARNQLADVIVQVLDPDALDPVAQETALAVADAVLGMIKPLEWYESGAEIQSQDVDHYYRIYANSEGMYTLDDNEGYSSHKSQEAAIEAANAHYRAQILAALGLDAEEGRT